MIRTSDDGGGGACGDAEAEDTAHDDDDACGDDDGCGREKKQMSLMNDLDDT